MPRKPKEPKAHRSITLHDLATFPVKKHRKSNATINSICKSFRRNNDLQQIYLKWLDRAIDREKDKSKHYEFLLQKFLAIERYIYHAEQVEVGVSDNDKSANLGRISYDLTDPTKATITVNLFASKDEIVKGIDYATERLLFERMMLRIKLKESFPAEIRISQGVDIDKVLNSLDDLLKWYDKYKDFSVTAIVSDMYGEEAIRDDHEFNRKKQTVYEKQRQAETCMKSAKLGTFPPRNLTRARSKRPRK